MKYMEGVILAATIGLCILFFAGDPDLHDAVIYWLTDGVLKACEAQISES